jgi:hypothetical protein
VRPASYPHRKDLPTRMKERDSIDLIAIAGTGQNGATLCCRLLGELPGCIAVGEIGRLWDKGLVENVDCACGAPFRECPFWSAVGDTAYGGWDALDREEVVRLYEGLTLKRSRLQHPFALPLITWPWLSPRYARDLGAYQTLMSKLYRAILDVSGAETIIDSMKIPAHVYMLAHHAEVRLKVVHLIRDPRGVVYSNTKKVVRQGTDASRPYRVQRSPLKSASKWIWFNLAHRALAAMGTPTMRLRYEDLVRDPSGSVRTLAAFAGVDALEQDLRFIHDSRADLRAGHIPAGNRMRLVSGPMEIRVDDEWTRELPERDRRVVTLMTWPLLRLFGFPTSPAAITTSARSHVEER